MKNKPLLLWGLGAGVIALVAFIVGYAFVWPGDGDGQNCNNSRDGQCSRVSGGMEGMMGNDGGCGAVGGDMNGMMNGDMNGMMGSPVDAAATPITIDQAVDAAKRYVTDQGDADLMVTSILEFTNGFYARVKEISTGTSAYELRVDRNNGDVSRTTGADMLWNKKYSSGMENMMGMINGTDGMMGDGGMMNATDGMMNATDGRMNSIENMMGDGGAMDCTNGGNQSDNNSDDSNDKSEGMDHGNTSSGGMMGDGGMMDGASVDDKVTTADMTVKAAEARGLAQKYADVQFPGSSTGEPEMFYGYYMIGLSKNGNVIGILSVNGFSGQVWLNAMYGTYLGGKSL